LIWRGRLSWLLGVLLLFLGVRVGQEVYRWYAFADHRAEMRGMTARLDEIGMAVVGSYIDSDTLRSSVVRMDARLSAARARVEAYEARGNRGTLPQTLFDEYRRELESYNGLIAERNRRLSGWEDAVSLNHEAVARYNRLADSIRHVAAAIGEPFYAPATPAEVAERRGLRLPETP
jgi:hypothetical protein